MGKSADSHLMNCLSPAVSDMNQAEARCTLLGANAQVVQAGTQQVQLALAAKFVQQKVIELLPETGSCRSRRSPQEVTGLPQPSLRVGKLVARR